MISRATYRQIQAALETPEGLLFDTPMEKREVIQYQDEFVSNVLVYYAWRTGYPTLPLLEFLREQGIDI